MRIISPFRDYYDGLASHDKADKPVYVRKPRELEIKDVPGFPLGFKMPVPAWDRFISRFCLGVCGKAFIGYRSEWKVYWTYPDVIDDVEALTFYPDDSHAIVPHYTQHQRRALREKVRKMTGGRRWERGREKVWGDNFRFSQKGWDAWLESRPDELLLGDKPFLAADSPLLYWYGHPDYKKRDVVIVNPDLSSLQLTGVLPVTTLAQEIEMYLGNQLAKQMDPTTTRTQEDVRDSKGFDKRSFKSRAPSEKKARRRAKKQTRKGAA